MTGDPGILSPS